MIGESASKAIKQSKDLAHHTWEYYKLQLFAQLATLISMIIKVVIIGGLSMIALLFFSVALAQFLGQVLEDETFGYVLMGGGLLLILVIVYGCRKHIENRVVQKLSENFVEE